MTRANQGLGLEAVPSVQERIRAFQAAREALEVRTKEISTAISLKEKEIEQHREQKKGLTEELAAVSSAIRTLSWQVKKLQE